MRKLFLLIISILLVQLSMGAIQVTTNVNIEQYTFKVNEFNFSLENSDYKFKLSSFDDFINNGKYINTSLYQYSSDIKDFGKYKINISLVTSDSVFNISHSFYYMTNVNRIEINCLIGKDNKGNAYLKELIVNRYIKSPKEIKINTYTKPKINESPLFEIINSLKDTLYNAPNNGIVYKEFSSNEYTEYSRFKFCTSDTIIQIFKPKEKVITYTCNEEDNNRFIIKENGLYLFEVYFSNINDNSTESLIESRIITIDKYRIIKKIKIK